MAAKHFELLFVCLFFFHPIRVRKFGRLIFFSTDSNSQLGSKMQNFLLLSASSAQISTQSTAGATPVSVLQSSNNAFQGNSYQQSPSFHQQPQQPQQQKQQIQLQLQLRQPPKSQSLTFDQIIRDRYTLHLLFSFSSRGI